MFILSLGAASLQRTYLKDSIEWKAAEAIAIANGYNPPTSVNPATAGEILNSIYAIDEEKLSETERVFASKAITALSWEPVIKSGVFGMTPSLILAPEIYKQTSTVERYSDYLFPVRDRYSAINFDVDLEYANTFYGFLDYMQLSPEHDKQYDKLFGTNLDAGLDTYHEGTMRAGALIGNDWMNFSVQRSRQSLGYGKTGVMSLADNFSRQDFMRLHTYSDIFDYTLNLTLFYNQNSSNVPMDFNFNGMHSIISLHRFDVKIANKVLISFTEGITAYTDNTLDLRLLNPFLFHHGFNNYSEGITARPMDGDEANNIFSFELGYTVIPHLRVRGEYIFDQIQLSGEAASAGARPNARGMLLGLDTSWILSEDMFVTAYAEFASTTPYLYLNYKENNDGTFQPNYDYIFGVHDWWGNHEVAYGGYRFGGDALVFGFGASLGKFDCFLIDAEFAYSKHGLYGLGYKNGLKNEFGPEHVGDKGPTGTPDEIENRVEIKVDGSISLLDYLDVSAGIGFVWANNYKNNPGAKFSDLQFKLGVALDVTEIFR